MKRAVPGAILIAVSLIGSLVIGLPAEAQGATKAQLVPSTQVPGPVPTQYQTEYAAVQDEVQSFSSSVGREPKHPITKFGTELLTANGNIGAGLLSPGAISGVERELDAFEALGIQGVTVDVSFPLLISSTPNSAGYLAFYEQVARQIRQRHMVFSVEENPIFSGTPLTALKISYAGLTLDSYATEERQEAQVIIDQLKPDYLSLLTEPDTYTDTLHLTLDTPDTAVNVVQKELSGLKRGHTQVGAGTGTWSSPGIDQALVRRTSIDYLDVHVYPFGPSAIANLSSDVRAAKAAAKPLVMDETWLNKPTSGEGLGPAGAPENLKVKSYSFWEPLDEQYVSAMARYVRSAGFSYVAFFDGARAFFGYLDWSPALEAASYQSFSAQYNAVVSQNMATLTVSGTGLAIHRTLTKG